MPQVHLEFNQSDDGLNLAAIANFPRQLDVNTLTVGGLAEWRHIGANVVTFNEATLEHLNVVAKAKNLSKVGVQFNGLKARTDILLPYSLRAGRNGAEKVKAFLTKTLKALGATSVRFTSTGVQVLANARMNDDEDGNY